MALSYGRMQDFPIRPLSKGMFTDLPPNGIPSGGFEDLGNFHVKEGYIQTRGGYWPYFNGSADLVGDDLITYDYRNLREKIQDVVYHWKTTAQSETLVISDQFLYSVVNQTTLENILYASETITVENDTVDANGILSFDILTGDDSEVTIGDYIREDGGTDVIGRLLSIVGSTYYFELDGSYTWIASTDVQFVHTFYVSPGFRVDYTTLGGYGTTEAGNEIILTDQSGRGVYLYTDGSLSLYDIDSSPLGDEDPLEQILGSAKTTTFYDDRLWLGNITEKDGSNYPQRIWWSNALNFKRFDPTGYLDLPYSEGELMALKPLGPNLVAYYSDTVYIGRPTQIAGRPYDFQELDTNGVGLVAQGALTSYDDGHFWVGQDDIYYLSQSSGLQRIGAPIRSVTVERTSDLSLLDYCQVASDPSTESVAFLFPDTSIDQAAAVGLSTKIWRFYYKPQAWAYDSVPLDGDIPLAYFSCISAARTVTKGQTYQDWYDLDGEAGDPAIQTEDLGDDPYTSEWLGNRSLNAIYQDDPAVAGTPPADQKEWLDFESYNDLNSFAVSAPRLYFGLYYIDSSGYFVQNISYEAKDADTDNIGGTDYPLTYYITSADYDFGHPDKDKFTRQVSFRTMEHADAEFLPTFWVSDGRARRNAITGVQSVWYQQASPVRFYTNYNEGRTGFLIRGSIFKFKMQFTRSTEQYRISEFVIRTKVEGEQIDQ